MLISPIQPIMSVFRFPGGQLVHKGFVANFSQNLGELCKVLPHLPENVSVIIIKKQGQNHNNEDFKVNRERVFACLSFLCENNDQYKTHGIEISLSNLALLPEDGIPDKFKTLIARSEKIEIDDSDIRNIDDALVNEEEDLYQAYIETEVNNLLEVDKISFKLNWPLTNPIPINEFNFDGICSLAFPKLFM